MRILLAQHREELEHIMQIIRLLLGKLILFCNWVFTPRSVSRDPAEQDAIDKQTATLALYQYEACPFCVKVRRAMKRNALTIEMRDVKRSPTARDELLTGGGRLKVPCLRIDSAEQGSRWMYESEDIIRYLEGRFAS